MSSVNPPRVPDGVGPAGRTFWKKITSTYELSLGELALLVRVCKTLDLVARIDRELAGAALLVPGSTGQMRANPLLEAKVAQERVLELLVRGLGLPLPGEKQGRRRTPSQVIKWKEATSGRSDRAGGAGAGAAGEVPGRGVARRGPGGRVG